MPCAAQLGAVGHAGRVEQVADRAFVQCAQQAEFVQHRRAQVVQQAVQGATHMAQDSIDGYADVFQLRLRIGERQGTALALLDIRDNGVGLPARLPRGGRGLQGMRDRVTALGGLFRVRPESQGVHLRVLLRSSTQTSDVART
jgi:glucose-6-phosphate-specific signal transduction histidine kinase